MALPGAMIGLLGGLIAGAFAALGGLPLAVVLVAAFALGIPLALGGAAYELLLATGRAPLGTLTPVALLWTVAFPPSCVLRGGAHGSGRREQRGDAERLADVRRLPGAASASPFAIGFWWLHENFVPRWWFHIRDRNPVADEFIRRQLAYAGEAEAEKERRRQRKRRR